MLYRITNQKELFEQWRKLEQETKTRLLAATFQNMCIVPAEVLNEDFARMQGVIEELKQSNYSGFVPDIMQLMSTSYAVVRNDNKIPITGEEFYEFREYCRNHEVKYEGFSGALADQFSADPIKHCKLLNASCNFADCPLQKRDLGGV